MLGSRFFKLTQFILLPGIVIFSSWPFISEAFTAEVMIGLSTEGVVIGSLLAFGGTLFRSLRTREMLRSAGKTSFNANLSAYVNSSIINMIAPFRLGEIYRAIILRKLTNISGFYIGLVILLERIIDLIIISAISIFLLVLNDENPISHVFALSLACFVVLILTIVSLQIKPILRFLFKLLNGLRPAVQKGVKHSLWVAMYGFRKFITTPRSLFLYLIYTVASWSLYLLGVYVGLTESLETKQDLQKITTPFTNYLTLARQSIPSFTENFNASFRSESLNLINELSAKSWLVLNLPILVLAISTPLWFRLGGKVENEVDSLLRTSSLFESDSHNIVDYFISSDPVVKELHKIEHAQHFRILKIFKGGSRAVTALIQRDYGEVEVIKTVKLSDSTKLKAQYDWLKNFEAHQEVVNPIGEIITENNYAYSMRMAEGFIPFYEFIHTHSIEKSKMIISEVSEFLTKNVYLDKHPNTIANVYETYFQNRILNAIEQAKSDSSDIYSLWEKDQILVNGCLLEGAKTILSRRTEEIRELMIDFNRTQYAHGDLTIDNILVKSDSLQFLLIDPSDDNSLRGPVLDFSRLLQSLRGGYEFLNYLDEKPRFKQNAVPEITFIDRRTYKYEQLAEHVFCLAQDKLTEKEICNLNLHIGLLYLRMLPHQIRINPEKVPIYYAKAIEFLNDWEHEVAYR